MIVNFKVNNFKGIEKEILIYTKASNKIKRDLNKCSFIQDNIKLLKTICIIGCNGSGKSSILYALETIQDFLKFPFRKNFNDNKEYIDYIKSLNNEELKKYLIKLNTLSLGEQNINRINEKTFLEIEIYIPKRKDNIPGFYNYKISYDKNYKINGVSLEKLTYRPKFEKKSILTLSKKSNIIESQIGTAILYENNNIKHYNTKFIKYYKSFADEILNYTKCFYTGGSTDIQYMLENYKSDFINLCNIADDKIVNVTIDENNEQRNLLFWNSNKKPLYFSQLSDGTRKIIVLGSEMLKALKNDSTLLVDEIDQSLHPALVEFLIKLISSKSKDNYSQLIFTTHSPLIAFSLENDELYFIHNQNNDYAFYNISSAIKNKMLTKDQSRQKAWVNNLLINNPADSKINYFIDHMNKF